MTIRAAKFTPEVLLSAPRRSAGIPNSSGSKVLHTVSTYSFSDHSKKSELRVLDVESQQTSLVAEDAGSVAWLGDDTILLLTDSEGGHTDLKVGSVDDFGNSSYRAGTLTGPIGDLKVTSLKDNGSDYGIAFSGKITPDGDLFNPSTAKKPLTTGRLYKKLFVRHWDHWLTENRNSIWLGRLKKGSEGKFELTGISNAVEDSRLESPTDPFGGTDNFDIGKRGLAFISKDPELNPALHTKTNLYLRVSDSLWDEVGKGNAYLFTKLTPLPIPVYGFNGTLTNPVFSPDGHRLAFLGMKTDGYESDKNQVFYAPDILTPSWVIHAHASPDGKGKWDRSPQSIIWKSDGFYFTAEDHGRVCLFESEYERPAGLTVPRMIVKGGTITDVQSLENGDLFISSTSLIDNSLYSLLPITSKNNGTIYSLPENSTTFSDPKIPATTKYISSQSKSGGMFGLTRAQIDEVHWPGAAKNTSIHAWVVKPSTFNSKEKYPLAYLIHGGPQGAWEDGWSTRWNPAVFAEQGFIVVCPNPTGSTGYGQDFTDAIKGEWGGLPYEDLVKGFEWIKENLDYVDTSHSVALGASYGGYMMNWIQGHPLGRELKALVTHDGVFSMTAQLASEELYFPFHDIGAPIWEKPDEWAKWDPSRFLANWSTPHLIIHSELDYRLTMNEGLAAFNTLQTRGVESQFLTFPDENHWVLKPENSLLWHETVLDWINEHVGLPKYTDSREGQKKEGAEIALAT
ncbi:dipeptidyl-peptidase-like protein V precursor [Lophiotrema nucula]|uniref:Dipeptidyl-peptidase V n=1 Tax=Lophiotrema nucula TaxID=690887 RepID=A0A6A5ZG62_9PLEO|nr:dipeptidyl-peptidase-like protein V precursor [Lophiotrema nucula]